MGERKYRKTWRILYYSYPFLGGIFGTLTYLIVFAGLITFSGTEQSAESAVSGLTNSTVSGGTNSTVSGGTDSNSRSLLFIPIAALAGFNWEWFMLIFNRIAEIITVTKERSTEKIQT